MHAEESMRKYLRTRKRATVPAATATIEAVSLVGGALCWVKGGGSPEPPDPDPEPTPIFRG
jgi:hypothetical protein